MHSPKHHPNSQRALYTYLAYTNSKFSLTFHSKASDMLYHTHYYTPKKKHEQNKIYIAIDK